MNICFLCRNLGKDWGGTETFVLNLANALDQEGHPIHIVAAENSSPEIRGLSGRVRIDRVPIPKTFPLFWQLNNWLPLEDYVYSRAVADVLDRIIPEEKIDIIENMDYFRQGFVYARRKKTAMLMRFHGWFFNRAQGDLQLLKSLRRREKFLRKLQKDSIARMDALVAVSHHTAQFARSVWDLGQREVRVVHNAVDALKFTPSDQT